MKIETLVNKQYEEKVKLKKVYVRCHRNVMVRELIVQ